MGFSTTPLYHRKNKIAAVRITSEPNRRNVYRIGVGYGTDTGPRGTLGWEDRRLNPSGHNYIWGIDRPAARPKNDEVSPRRRPVFANHPATMVRQPKQEDT